MNTTLRPPLLIVSLCALVLMIAAITALPSTASAFLGVTQDLGGKQVSVLGTTRVDRSRVYHLQAADGSLCLYAVDDSYKHSALTCNWKGSGK